MLLHLEVTGQALRLPGEPERWTAHNQTHAHRSDPRRRRPGRCSRSSSSRPRPRQGEENLYAALAELRAAGAVVRVGHLRRRRLHAASKTIEIVKRIRERVRAWRRWRTSPASGRPCRSCARRSTRCRRRGHRQRARPARRPARRARGVDEDGGRPGVLARAGGADRRGLPVRDRRRLLPRDAHPREQSRRRTCEHLAEKVRGGRATS